MEFELEWTKYQVRSVQTAGWLMISSGILQTRILMQIGVYHCPVCESPLTNQYHETTEGFGHCSIEPLRKNASLVAHPRNCKWLITPINAVG